MARDVIGIDVGGTAVKAMRVAAGGTVEQARCIPTPGHAAALTAAVVELASTLAAPSTAAIGVICPGIVDDGIARFAVNVAWRDEPVRERVHAGTGLPVFVARDVAAAALAESLAVAASDVVFVSIGTGIASAHVVGGVLREGTTGRAGEMGHTPVYPDGEPCQCGQRGCLEAYASAAAIARRYDERTATARTAREIADRLGQDPDADAVWAQAIDALALALVTETMVADPAMIVIGGGLAGAGERLLDPLRAAVAARLAWRPAPPIVAARLGADAGALGAAQLAWRGLDAGQLDTGQQEGASS